MTLESEETRVKREADESYELGPNRDRLDLVIEVVITRGGINKLEDYKRLQIPEVWFWEQKRLLLYTLQADGYQEIRRSEVLKDLDIDLLEQCINAPNHLQAVKEFRQALQALQE